VVISLISFGAWYLNFILFLVLILLLAISGSIAKFCLISYIFLSRLIYLESAAKINASLLFIFIFA